MSAPAKNRTFTVNGRTYQDLGHGTGKRALPPWQPPADDAAALTNHTSPEKRAQGWRIEWIFLIGVILLSCIGLTLLSALI